MKIQELEIKNFGKLNNRKVEFTPGINIVSGNNESGKTTLYDFLKGMLFGMSKSRGRVKNDDYTHYTPWSNPGEYAGIMRFEQDGLNYRVRRVFQKDSKEAEFVCETTGETYSIENGDLTRLLGGITESSYTNTMSIGQLSSQTDDTLVSELQNYAANYCGAGGGNIDVIGSYKKLKDKGKECSKKLETIKKQREDRLSEIIEREKYLAEKYEGFESELSEKKSAVSEIRPQKDKLEDDYRILTERSKELDEKEEKLRERISNVRDAEVRYEERLRSADENAEADERYRKNHKKKGSNILFILLIIIGFLGIFLGLYFGLIAKKELVYIAASLGAGAICFIIGVIGIIIRSGKTDDYSEYMYDEDAVEEYRDKLEMAHKKRESLDEELEKLKQEKEETALKIEEIRTSISSVGDEQASNSGKVDSIEEQISEIKVELDNLAEEKEELENETHEEKKLRLLNSAIDIAQKRMDSMAELLGQKFGMNLRKRASEILSEVTGGKYKDLIIDDQLNMKLNTPERMVPIEVVSRGTIDQIYFALRMAVLETIYEDELPVILDDALVLYDEIRMGETLKWLSKNKKQVIIFTCHRREEEYLRRNNIKYNKCIVSSTEAGN